MVNWEGIEDLNVVPTRVWLSRTKEREKDREEWAPLRKADCAALNNNPENRPVIIEGGRATADPEFGVIRANFVPRPLRALESAIWFVVEEHKKDAKTGKTRPVLSPMPDHEAERVEDFYQRAIYAASSLGTGIDPLLKEQVALEGTDYNVEIAKEGGHYHMKKSPKGWFGKSYDLQRGYGAYTIEGEEEETILGPVRHVVFVIHGIGEAMWSRDDFNLAPSWLDLMDKTRLTMQRRQIADLKKKCDLAKAQKRPEPDPPNRVEYLPITWHDQVHSSNSSLMRSLNSATLSTIPALRAIANDVILDVLLYLTPNYCYDVLENVTDQIITLYAVFKKIYPDFATQGGKASLIGHSLGSVICWDLLSLKKESLEQGTTKHGVHITTSTVAGNAANISYQQFTHGTNVTSHDAVMKIEDSESRTDDRSDLTGFWGPSLPKSLPKVLPFEPDFTVFLGSPIGLFLTLRGSHDVFDSMRSKSDDGGKAKTSSFRLPTKSLYNIFSPSDPVAYRIEPLLLPLNTLASELPEPLYVTRLGEDVRFHVKAMKLGDEITKAISKQRSSISMFMSTISEQASSVLHQIEDSSSVERSTKKGRGDDTAGSKDQNDTLRFPLGGRSARIDYQLQPRVIDNEYISAVTAHSSYFQNTDIIDFVIDLADRKGDELIDLTEVDVDIALTTSS